MTRSLDGLTVLALAAALLLAPGCARETTEGVKMANLDLAAAPPVAKKVEHTETRHGEVVEDPYFWLRDDERKAPEVIAYLEAENAYTEAVMKPTEEFRTALYDEMLARIKETDLSVPVRVGDYHYYSRTEEGKQYPIHCRKKGGLDADEEIILDENELARGHDYFRVGAFNVSPDHNLLAFSVDIDGGENYTLQVKDLRSGEMLPDSIPGTYYALEWAADNATLFYTTVDAAHRPYRLHRHRLGADPAQDAVVYQEDDESYFLSVYKTSSKQYLMLILGSQVTNEVHYLRADDPQGGFQVMHPREHQVEYFADHWGDNFYIVTNADAVNFKVVEAPVSDPEKENWKDVIPAPRRREDRLDQDLRQPHGRLVARERAARLARDRTPRLDRAPGRLRRAGLHRSHEREPRVRDRDAALHVTSR